MVDGTLLRDIGYETMDGVRMGNGCWPLQRDDDMSVACGEFAAKHFREGKPHSDCPGQGECVGACTGIHLESMMRQVIRDFMADEPHRRILIEQGVDTMGVGTHVEHVRNSLYILIAVVRTRRTGG